MTPEEAEAHREYQRQWRANLTPEQKAERAKKQREWRTKIAKEDPERWKEIKRKKCISQRNYYNNHKPYYKRKAKEYRRKFGPGWGRSNIKRKAVVLEWKKCDKCDIYHTKARVRLYFTVNLTTGNVYSGYLAYEHKIKGKPKACYTEPVNTEGVKKILDKIGYDIPKVVWEGSEIHAVAEKDFKCAKCNELIEEKDEFIWKDGAGICLKCAKR